MLSGGIDDIFDSCHMIIYAQPNGIQHFLVVFILARRPSIFCSEYHAVMIAIAFKARKKC